MTLDEAKRLLKTFSFDDGKLNSIPILDVTPETHPDLYNTLWALVQPGVDKGLLTEREVEAIGVYVSQWNREEADELITAAILEKAQHVG